MKLLPLVTLTINKLLFSINSHIPGPGGISPVSSFEAKYNSVKFVRLLSHLNVQHKIEWMLIEFELTDKCFVLILNSETLVEILHVPKIKVKI